MSFPFLAWTNSRSRPIDACRIKGYRESQRRSVRFRTHEHIQPRRPRSTAAASVRRHADQAPSRGTGNDCRYPLFAGRAAQVHPTVRARSSRLALDVRRNCASGDVRQRTDRQRLTAHSLMRPLDGGALQSGRKPAVALRPALP
jgi:hypothetical protein